MAEPLPHRPVLVGPVLEGIEIQVQALLAATRHQNLPQVLYRPSGVVQTAPDGRHLMEALRVQLDVFDQPLPQMQLLLVNLSPPTALDASDRLRDVPTCQAAAGLKRRARSVATEWLFTGLQIRAG